MNEKRITIVQKCDLKNVWITDLNIARKQNKLAVKYDPDKEPYTALVCLYNLERCHTPYFNITPFQKTGGKFKNISRRYR